MRVVTVALETYKTRRIEPLSKTTDLDVMKHRQHMPWWRSYASFDRDELQRHMVKDPYLKNFMGTEYIDRVWIDMDRKSKEDSLQEVWDETLGVYDWLIHEGAIHKQVQIWFSGQKGFHIEFPNLFGIEPQQKATLILKHTLSSLQLSRFIDLHNVSTVGLIRGWYSKHNKSKGHKVPVEPTWSLDLIKEKSLTIPIEVKAVTNNVSIPVWKTKIVKPNVQDRYGKSSKLGLSLSVNPDRRVTCMQKLLGRGVIKGRRHKDIIPLVTWMKRMGMPLAWIQKCLIDWLAPTLEDNQDYNEWFKQIQVFYDAPYYWGCNHEVASEFCDPKCMFYKHKNFGMSSELKTYDELYEGLQAHMDKLDSGAGIDLAGIFDGSPEYRVLPAELFILAGDTGIGKSLMITNWIVKMQRPTLWLNLEMTETTQFKRVIQVHTGLDALHVREAQTPDLKKIAEGIREYYVQYTIAPRLEDIEAMLQDYPSEILVVDTTDAIIVPSAGSNEYHKMKVIISSLRSMAYKYNVVIICVHHINKEGSKNVQGTQVVGGFQLPKRRITVNDLMGARDVATKAEHVFGLEKTGEDTFELYSIKARDSEPYEAEYRINWDNYRIHLKGSPDAAW